MTNFISSYTFKLVHIYYKNLNDYIYKKAIDPDPSLLTRTLMLLKIPMTQGPL